MWPTILISNNLEQWNTLLCSTYPSSFILLPHTNSDVEIVDINSHVACIFTPRGVDTSVISSFLESTYQHTSYHSSYTYTK